MGGSIDLGDTGQIVDSTTTAGSASAAILDLGTLRSNVDVFVDVSGAATLTVEVSTTGEFGGEERQVETVDYEEAITDFRQYDFAYQHVRAWVHANINRLEIVGRGI